MGTDTLDTRTLALLREDPHRTPEDLAVLLGVPVLTVIDALDRLVERAMAVPDAD